MNRKWSALSACLTLFLWMPVVQGNETVQVVLDSTAPRLEQFAAQEVADQLARLFDAMVVVRESPDKRTAEHTVLLGSPDTNSHIRTHFAKEWPELSDQGIFIRGTRHLGKPTILVGGGSPVATLWAVYELGYRFGVRYMLHGDVFPTEAVPLRFEGLDIKLEPEFRTRAWETIGDLACGSAAWGIEEQRRVLGQLAKLKFNQVVLSFSPWQPFVDYEFHGVNKSSAQLWHGGKLRVDGDTAGRQVFQGATEFHNPDFVGKKSYDELAAAGTNLAHGIIDAAHELGMTATLCFSVLEFPPEFETTLPESDRQGVTGMALRPGPRQLPNDPVWLQLAKTKIHAYRTTYPNVDAICLTLPELPHWREHSALAWSLLGTQLEIVKQNTLEEFLGTAISGADTESVQRRRSLAEGNINSLAFLQALLADDDLLKRKHQAPLPIMIRGIDSSLSSILEPLIPKNAGRLHGNDRSVRDLAADTELFGQMSAADAKQSSLVLSLHDEGLGPLPQCALSQLHELFTALHNKSWDGFLAAYPLVGDASPMLNYLSRASFDARMTPQESLEEFFAAVCGAATVASMTEFYTIIERATDIIHENDSKFGLPVPGVMMKHYYQDGLAPAWWAETLSRYGEAYNEVGRALHGSTLGGRPQMTYTLKRVVFGLLYFRTLQALRLAGDARQKGEAEQELEQVETALDFMYDGLRAMAEQTRSHSDLGAIAVLNAYGYHPILRKVNELQATEDDRE